MTLRDFIVVSRRWWWVVLLGTVLAGVVAYLLTTRITPIYEAKADLLVNPRTGDGANLETILGSQSLTKTYARLAEANRHLELVVAEVPDITVEKLEKKVSARAVPETQIIEVTVRDPDPERAALIANTILRTLPVFVRDVQLGGAPDDGTVPINRVTPYSVATPPKDPSSPDFVLNIALGAILGLLVSVVAVSLIEYLDDGIDEREDVEALGVPFLGAVLQATPPKGVDRRSWVPSIIHEDARSPLAESYRQLQANLAFALTASDTRVLLVTSPSQGEGKSTTAANLAEALAESSKKVLLIDGDLRKPDAHRYFSLPNASGLTSAFLVETAAVAAFPAKVTESLAVLTGGPVAPNPTELLSSRKLKAALDVLKEPYDVVVIDSPPMVGLADAALWATLVDGVLLVARRGKTRRGPLEDAIAIVRASRKPLLGVVLNGSTRKSAGLYDYRYGYGDRNGKKPER
jgi:receptor protein-tyrosine kinase